MGALPSTPGFMIVDKIYTAKELLRDGRTLHEEGRHTSAKNAFEMALECLSKADDYLKMTVNLPSRNIDQQEITRLRRELLSGIHKITDQDKD